LSRPSPAVLSPEPSRPNPPESTRHDRRPDPHPHRRSLADNRFRRPIPRRAKPEPRDRSRVPSLRRTAIRHRSASLKPDRRSRPARKHAPESIGRYSTDRQIPIGPRLSPPAPFRPAVSSLGGFRTPAPARIPASTPAPRPASETLHRSGRSERNLRMRQFDLFTTISQVQILPGIFRGLASAAVGLIRSPLWQSRGSDRCQRSGL
jgi:hypothetical protein